MTELHIRTDGDVWDVETIALCPHISIRAKSFEDDPGSEYRETLHLYCDECGTEHTLHILVN